MTTKPVPKGVEITDNITKHMDRRFISSIDLMGAGKVILTIDRVEGHKKLNFLNDNSKDNALLIYFKESKKPLLLCKTNIKAIAFSVGSAKVEDWKGKKIGLEVQNVKCFGKIQPAVRVV